MSVLAPNPHILYRETHHREHTFWNGASYLGVLKSNGVGFDRRNYDSKKIEKRNFRVDAMWPDLSRPTSVELEPIQDCDQLDQILLNSRQLSQPIIIDWMAAWCRKCIYLKPKLEKLAAEYDTKIKFYCVDVNKVPQALVKRANISKMPTIQDDKILDKVLCEKDVGNGVSFFHRIIKLWKDGEMKAEVIGGHKAWLVLDEVREMIQKFR